MKFIYLVIRIIGIIVWVLLNVEIAYQIVCLYLRPPIG